MSVGSEVPSAGESQPANPSKSAWDVRPFMILPWEGRTRASLCCMRETQFSEPGACDHYHTAMWPVKGQQSAVPGSGCPWGVSFPGQGLGLASLWSKEQQRHPGQRTSVLLALAKKRWKAGKGAPQKSAGGGVGLTSMACCLSVQG